ncbi:MAG: Na+:solute symporter [Planctomycetes bacterium]|nr:Na+:solute symporter [Planctomycetota bacterium]
MQLAPIDWAVIILYVIFALGVGAYFARRAGSGVEEFFLSGRRLPWWLAGTSLVATTFASDTPLVVTGWVRDDGIWRNWIWWGAALGSVFTVMLFARYWQRGKVMTSAELAELRYGGKGAKVLRASLGIFQAGFTNCITLCWVILAAAKIQGVVFGVNKELSIVIACATALTYCSMAGLWGVVVTDFVQFLMAMTGSIALAVLAWNGIEGMQGVREAMASADSSFAEQTLNFFPSAGPGSFWDASFWTTGVAAIAVYLGVQWWARDNADGGALVVQRVSSARSERDGVFAVLWYNVAHFALRPWPWIIVAVASLIVLPHQELTSPIAGTITALESPQEPEWIEVQPDAGPAIRLRPDSVGSDADWHPTVLTAGLNERVEPGTVLAKTDSERAYVVMMGRYLPVGLLGLAVAALLAAFMSTVDTHVNLAASFFVGDLYRRFLVKDESDKHYVLVARIASAGVLALAGLFAYEADSINNLFVFFLTFTAGVGPVYLARWFWWRVQAWTEVTAMCASALAATSLTFGPLSRFEWPMGAFVQAGELTGPGKLILVVIFSAICSLLSIAIQRKPDPASLCDFYTRVRPMGAWGPVRALCGNLPAKEKPLPIIVGSLGGSLSILGSMLAMGGWLFDRPQFALSWLCAAAVGVGCLAWGLSQVERGQTADSQTIY